MSDRSNDILELTKEYINFSKRLEETDENVKLICNEIKNSEEQDIKRYFKRFFRIQEPLHTNVVPFFRIITLTEILNSSDILFNTKADFITYVNNFKERLRNENFPDNFSEDIRNVGNIGTIRKDDKEYQFDINFVREFVKLEEERLPRQFQFYGKFNFFRHFLLFFTPIGVNLSNTHSNVWERIFNYVIELLELDPDEYFIDNCRFYKPRGQHEDDLTWGALAKSNIGEFETEEHRTSTLQLFINFNPRGLDIGTYLGKRVDEALRGYIESNSLNNKDFLINYFKELYEKYGDNLNIEILGDRIIRFEGSFDDETFREQTFDLFRSKFAIFYSGFRGDINSFNNIIKDLFNIYSILVGERAPIPPSTPIPDIRVIVERNLKPIDFLSIKSDIINELDNLIGIEIDKIIEKVLRLLNAGKNIILEGAPGTGKTVILETIFKIIKEKYEAIDDIIITTATSDWTLFETIGGLVPEAEKLEFRPGLFLGCFKKRGTKLTNNWLMVDELNRANIDKAFGYFFSLFSDQSVELPFKDKSERTIKIIPLNKYKNEGLSNDQIKNTVDLGISGYDLYFISPNWRMGGTINSADKASLHQLSHAFIRRFGFVQIPVPKISDFISTYPFKSLKKEDLQKVWDAINTHYQIGPAIIIDMDFFLESSDLTIIDAFEAYILPQINTLPDDILLKIIEALKSKFSGSIGEKFELYKPKF